MRYSNYVYSIDLISQLTDNIILSNINSFYTEYYKDEDTFNSNMRMIKNMANNIRILEGMV